MTMRKAKLVPWYHVNKDRCEINTVSGPQCKNSASYSARSGKNGSTQEIPVCKPHADILQLDIDCKWAVRRIHAKVITV
jgi:hypothetical protein